MSATANARTARIAELTKSALERDPREWTTFLRETCGADAVLRAEVESLLQYQKCASGFMQQPAVHVAARMLIRDRELKPDETLGDYQIISLIGGGGMGDVYLAHERKFQRQVALKIVRRGVDTADVIRRFEREEQILAGLTHPNIARLYGGAVTAEGLPYFVMEYVDGPRLDEYCRLHASTLSARLALFQKVCAAVAYAHQHLVIHRDLKPANIRVTADGEPKLLDFGIAKMLDPDDARFEGLTMTFPTAMTPEYASPEQIRGESMTTASDIYSLGVVLYELLTGARPYRLTSRNPGDIARAITEQEPARPSAVADQKLLRGDLDNIVLMALRKEPERRYDSVAQFSADIGRHLSGLPVKARKDTLSYRSTKFIKRNTLGVAAATLLFLSLVGGILVAQFEARRAETQRLRAEKRFNDVRRLANSFLFEIDPKIENLQGATEARETLVRRALEYLDSLAGEAGEDQSLQSELGAAYFKIGNIQGKPFQPNLGDARGALASFHKAESIFEKLLLREPGNDLARQELGYTYQYLGNILGEAGDSRANLANQAKAVKEFQTLAASDRVNVEYRLNLVRGYNYLATATLDLAIADESIQLYEQALESHRKAIAMVEELAQKDVTNKELRRQLAATYQRIGYTLRSLDDLKGESGNYPTALGYDLEAQAVFDELSESEPTNILFKRHTADARLSVGHSQLGLGNAALALTAFKEAQTTLETLVGIDAMDMQARHDLADCYRKVAETLIVISDWKGGMDYDRKALELYQALPMSDPIRSALIQAYEIMADGLAKTGDKDGAAENYRKALSLTEKWIAAAPSNKSAQRKQALDYARLERVR